MNITQNLSFRVEPMNQLAEVDTNPFYHHLDFKNADCYSKAKKDEDDWTGTTNAKERRKRQNRLNIRAFSM